MKVLAQNIETEEITLQRSDWVLPISNDIRTTAKSIKGSLTMVLSDMLYHISQEPDHSRACLLGERYVNTACKVLDRIEPKEEIIDNALQWHESNDKLGTDEFDS